MSRPLDGDWRSGHGGADRLAHLFTWKPFASDKSPMCDVRGGPSYRRIAPNQSRNVACRECLYRMGIEESIT